MLNKNLLSKLMLLVVAGSAMNVEAGKTNRSIQGFLGSALSNGFTKLESFRQNMLCPFNTNDGKDIAQILNEYYEELTNHCKKNPIIPKVTAFVLVVVIGLLTIDFLQPKTTSYTFVIPQSKV